MKILLLHLSDIHLKSRSNPIMDRARSISAATFSRIHSASAIFIVISGDVAFSGARNEYEAASAFLNELRTALTDEIDAPIHFILAPGNHDCDFSGDQSVRQALIDSVIQSKGSGLSSAIVGECIKVQQNFTEFRNTWGPDEKTVDEALWISYPFDIDGYKVSFDCLNVAWMSQLHEKQGQLIFPIEQFEHLKSQTVHLRIAVLHHPLNWYGQTTYRPFRKFIRSLAQIVITGHEHEQNIGENLDAESDHSAYIEGGVLQAEDVYTPPSFNIVELDLSEDNYSCELHTWNGSRFEPQEEAAWQNYRPLPHKRSNELSLTNEFSKKLDDPGGAFSHPGKQNPSLSDVYIFPDLRHNEEIAPKVKDTVNSGILRDFNLLSVGILIKGEEKTGKTSLIYQLFKYFYDNGYAPLLLRGTDLKPNDKELKKAITRAVEQQYGKESLTQFEQVSTVKKIVFVDDFDAHKLTNTQRSEILKYLRTEFGGLLITVSNLFEIDEVISKGSISSLVGYREYEMLEFGHKLRFELIRKWASLGTGSGRDNADVIAQLDRTEKALTALVGRNLVPRVPIYLLTLLQSLELGQSSELQNSAYGDCYRFLITGALGRSGVKPIELQEYFQFCSYLSWEFCKQKSQELDEAKLITFNDWFSKTYHRRDFRQRFDRLIDSKIIEQQGEYYSFCYPYIYYFFLGKYLSENLQDKVEIREMVEQYCNHLYVRDYANTILFLAHHSRSSFIYESIAGVLKGLFADKAELNFKSDTNALSYLVTSAPTLVFHEGDVIEHRRDAAAIRDEMTEPDKESEAEEINKVEENGLSLFSKLTLLFKTIEILGQILKNQYATISNPEKKELLDEIFKGPLRALRDFFDFMAGNGEGLISEIDRFIADHAATLTEEKRKQLARDAVFLLIGEISFGAIYKTSASVGSEHLRETIAAVVESSNTDAYRLIELAVKLESQGNIPYPLIKDLTKRTEGNAFSRHILKRMVLNYLYMFNTKITDKQKLCSELDIPIENQRLIDLKTKNSKRQK